MNIETWNFKGVYAARQKVFSKRVGLYYDISLKFYVSAAFNAMLF